MAQEENPIIEMTLEGDFVSPPTPPSPPLGVRIMMWAVVAAVVALSALIVALTIWFMAMLLPVILIAAVIAWIVVRFQVWRGSRTFTTWRAPD